MRLQQSLISTKHHWCPLLCISVSKQQWICTHILGQFLFVRTYLFISLLAIGCNDTSAPESVTTDNTTSFPMLACQEPAAVPASFLQIFLVESTLMILPYIGCYSSLKLWGSLLRTSSVYRLSIQLQNYFD